MHTDEIRTRFLDFFKERGHTMVKSDSLVPQNDPTLLFTGAGMNQFKDYFLGLKKDLKRATSSQKCLRTGDLDEVGRTAFHHSFFEMLGNFSFGDYFKREAIQWGWEFLTKEMGLSKERLRISLHQSDQEAFEIWQSEIGISEAWITRLGDQSNFWPSNAPQEGPNGPCGPCSEIYYDQGENHCPTPQSCSIEHDCGRFAEIWNLVFTQYDRQDGGKLVPLKNKNIDTGMGLERLACVVQKKKSNFEIDLFEPLICQIEELFKIKRTPASLSHVHAIADHIRATAFAIADGVMPGNEGRNYVIRKLIRRAIWHACQLVPQEEFDQPTLYHLMPAIVSLMKGAYPDLLHAQRNMEDTLKGEEERFLRTLSTGLELLKTKIHAAKQKGQKILSGEEVFFLYDTYGFPDELTRVIAKNDGIEIDQKVFGQLMEEQRKRAKKTSSLGESIFVSSEFDKQLHELPPTEFLGYEKRESKGRILLFQQVGDRGILVLDRTPFYAESGGQVGDRGVLKGPGFEALVEDTQKKDHYFLHEVKVLQGQPKEGLEVECRIDSNWRDRAMRNHTATHLLHAVLREILGKQVRQVGSLVHPDRLRFDYSYSKSLSEKELLKIERRVNEEILKNTPLEKQVKNFEEAKEEGAMAFFGEKYGRQVRVVTVPGISKELCGGTHCEETGQIGIFVITSDSSIASGVRRIEALTGEGGLEYLQKLRSQMRTASDKLRATPAELADRVEKLQQRIKQLEKGAQERSGVSLDLKTLTGEAQSIGNYRLILKRVDEAEREDLRKLSDHLRSQVKQTVWAFFSFKNQKIYFLVGLSPDLKNSAFDARDLTRQLMPLIGGSGGGRKDLVEGGGVDGEALGKNWEKITETARNYLTSQVKS